MKKAFLCLTTVLISLGVARANLEERNRAMALSKSGDHKAAIEVFVKLADGTNETRKSENLLQAALCAQRMGDNSKAMEFAGQIPSEPYATFCKMEILRSSGGRSSC